ncbi:MAG: flagellar basal-body MS-ring/collar protein FliF [candidate division KSB1 bacterium]|nr:flagellar basal-body MS-ring/collar protein FliF [candidate division KSB1 bacterium]MDZ7385521.1 flagellar basal-body MS-ring/collar protein FliF [candidate division KSB1 bacterium]MDZ7392628.1 flagellar basal-body MS-ring/collar protein FliF [candidate division KSB1 bacterium]MDZ7412978.1 flagellar basal-body MS-ring/collar protein FliF [candidate division KSB1 bacterium]
MAEAATKGKSFSTWYREVSAQYTPVQKVVFVVTLAAIVGGFFFLLRWATQPEFVTLYSDMDLKDGEKVVELLRSSRVPYRLEEGGRAILVPANRVYELRMKLAAEDLPRSGKIGYEVFDKKDIGVSEFVQSVNYQRALEGELGRTIQALSEVEFARVHLVFPKDRLFKEDQQKPTASVLLRLRPGARLREEQVAGIANLVANSVEGLDERDVTIVDTEGRILSDNTERDSVVGLSASQLELQKKVEAYLQSKAQTMLDGVLGPGNAIVRVAAELNFKKADKVAESYDPDLAAVLSQENLEETSGDTSGKPLVSSRRTVTNYQVSKTVEHVVESVGNIERLSVAVLVNGAYRTSQGPDGGTVREYVPRSEEELSRLEAMVKGAVGFSEERGDQFEITNLQFDTSLLTEGEEWLKTVQRKERMAFYVSLGQKILVGVLLLLLLALLRSRLRRFRGSLTAAEQPSAEQLIGAKRAELGAGREAPELSEDAKARAELEKQVVDFTRENPRAAARLIRYWLVEE